MDGSLDFLGRKWAMPILLELFSGRNTFNRLLEAIPGVSSKTLSARISDFVEAGILVKRRSEDGKSRVLYELTEKGEDFRLLARELAHFSLRWRLSPRRVGSNVRSTRLSKSGITTYFISATY